MFTCACEACYEHRSQIIGCMKFYGTPSRIHLTSTVQQNEQQQITSTRIQNLKVDNTLVRTNNDAAYVYQYGIIFYVRLIYLFIVPDLSRIVFMETSITPPSLQLTNSTGQLDIHPSRQIKLFPS
ncbi:unnamed protein product [Adineta steineri]|uniref:Uncharacterized protein n=1 Tax=Adineta steineri TaxID=433720 RepID=A0A814MGU8_9BILA|nr:unnamed protein product [Adineta steineri]CAF1077750.1 unnamed protein product [Adineta steineri]